MSYELSVSAGHERLLRVEEDARAVLGGAVEERARVGVAAAGPVEIRAMLPPERS